MLWYQNKQFFTKIKYYIEEKSDVATSFKYFERSLGTVLLRLPSQPLNLIFSASSKYVKFLHIIVWVGESHRGEFNVPGWLVSLSWCVIITVFGLPLSPLISGYYCADCCCCCCVEVVVAELLMS